MPKCLPIYPHHKATGPCFTRPAYRDGRRKRAVKVFTIADESSFLLIFGVPSLDIEKAFREKLKKLCSPKSVEKVDYPDVERFTETFLVKFPSVSAARRVKTRLDDTSFYGGLLRIVYAPEYETIAECRVKLHSFRRYNDVVASRTEDEINQRLSSITSTLLDKPSTSSCNSSDSIQIPLQAIANNDDPLKPTEIDTRNPYHLVKPQPNHPGFSTARQTAGDAIDESRQHWTAFGCDFATLPPSTQIQIQISSANYIEPPKISFASSAEFKRPIPEAVLQAMSCRPIIEHETPLKRPRLDDPPKSLIEGLSPDSPVVPSHLTAFLPRSVACRRILLKEMSRQLGPLQGCAPRPQTHRIKSPTSQQLSESQQDKRIVFHRKCHNPTDKN